MKPIAYQRLRRGCYIYVYLKNVCKTILYERGSGGVLLGHVYARIKSKLSFSGNRMHIVCARMWNVAPKPG